MPTRMASSGSSDEPKAEPITLGATSPRSGSTSIHTEVNWATFSSRLMRPRRSATRSSIGTRPSRYGASFGGRSSIPSLMHATPVE